MVVRMEQIFVWVWRRSGLEGSTLEGSTLEGSMEETYESNVPPHRRPISWTAGR